MSESDVELPDLSKIEISSEEFVHTVIRFHPKEQPQEIHTPLPWFKQLTIFIQRAREATDIWLLGLSLLFYLLVASFQGLVQKRDVHIQQQLRFTQQNAMEVLSVSATLVCNAHKFQGKLSRT